MPSAKIPNADIQSAVRMALAEDIGDGDITAALISSEQPIQAEIICREAATLCGTAWAEAVFQQLDQNIELQWRANDGETVREEQVLCALSGPARTILSGERCALNFLQTLSATATQTARYVNAVKDTKTIILDTRKTIPGLRSAQKYAVACGGGQNHRHGLFDAFLIKENHILAAGSIRAAIQTARQLHPDKLLEVEVETLEELDTAIQNQADRILLDNFSIAQLQEAVNIAAGKIPLEASGNITLATINDIAKTGVDYISIGGLTKNIKAIDLSMRFI